MNSRITPLDALARVPGWEPARAEVTELKGGLTNRTYRVVYDGRHYALRLDVEDADVLRVDRTYEATIMQAAHMADLGPELVHVDRQAGIMVTGFLPGRPWEDSDLESPGQLERLAESIRRIHDLPLCGQRVNLLEDALGYAAFLERRRGPQAFATHCVEVIRGMPVSDRVVCCHNDLIAGNVIDDGRLKLIDWEYARDNDPMFDLAVTIGFHDLDRSRRDILLNAYSGSSAAEFKEQLAEQIRAYDATQWLWFAARQLVAPSRELADRLEALQQRIR